MRRLLAVAIVENVRRVGRRVERTRFVRAFTGVRTIERHEAKIGGRWVAMVPGRYVTSAPTDRDLWVHYHAERGWEVTS